MNRLELTKRLASAGISDSGLSFYPANDKYCLLSNEQGWIVQFLEHGVETYHAEFTSEDAACMHLFHILSGTRPISQPIPLVAQVAEK
jgi:hypothetical protein